MTNLPARVPSLHPSTTCPRATVAAAVALVAASLVACSGGAFGDAAADVGTRSGAAGSGGGSNAVVVTVSPGARTMSAGTTGAFTCRVTGAVDTSCRWSVLEGASGGTVTPDGAYTAPARAGTYHVVATSRAAPERSTSATVLVTSAPRSCAGACPAPGSGITWEPERRFPYGLDRAWGAWGAGLTAWSHAAY